MSALNKKLKELELQRVLTGKLELEYKIAQRMDEIERLEENIKISEDKIKELQEEIKNM
jgi:peptidoglycan hydrolase CwlO-like protein